MTIVDEYAKWLASWSESEKTLQARRTVAATVVREFGLAGLTVENLQQFVGRPNLSRWSRATYTSHLNDFCSWLVATERLAANPIADDRFRKPKRPSALPRPLSEAEVDRVLDAAEGRTRDWILFALLAGLRAHEIAKIRGEDITQAEIFVEGKGKVRATIPTHPDIWSMTERYPRRGFWFPGRTDGHLSAQSVSINVGALFRDLGISGSIHRCRHVYGTRLLRSGANIRTVQKLMRHASLATTAGYTAVDEDEMRAAIRGLSA